MHTPLLILAVFLSFLFATANATDVAAFKSRLLTATKRHLNMLLGDDGSVRELKGKGGDGEEALAKGGVRFTDGYSSGCICSPGRVGLMTGRYQAHIGHDANPGEAGRELLRSETTTAQPLEGAGCMTGIAGKWQLGDTAPEFKEVKHERRKGKAAE